MQKTRPGSMYEQYRQMIAVFPGLCSFPLFWRVWTTDFKEKLLLSTGFTHTQCPTCVKHKLLIKSLTADAHARLRQRMLYDRHLKEQFCDRQMYWQLRATSRLLTQTIVIIIDGIDQAKFAWPRSSFFESHMFDKFNRPRLHIWGVIVHGYWSFLSLSHADSFKGGSTTVELIAFVLTQLHKQGVDLAKTHIHIQLDNTSSSNKNNTVLSFLALLTGIGLIFSAAASFLRVGHTHEDIDQWFSSLARWVRSKLMYAETLSDFQESFVQFFKKHPRHHEKNAKVLRFDNIRNWKSYLACMGKKIKGIAGPSAPHLFEFSRAGTWEKW